MEICRFCLKTIQKPLSIDKMTKEVIGLLMLKLDLHIIREPVMCYGCAETLQTAFDFNSTCIYTKDCLQPFIEGKTEARLVLRDIYLKVNDNEDIESVKRHEVCRFCLKPCDSGRCTPVDVLKENVEIKKLLEKYLPEVVMGVIEKPVACENCCSFLHQYSLFVTSFSDVEQLIQSYTKTLGRECIGELDLRQVRDFSLSNVIKREVETIVNDKVTKEEVMIFSEIESEEKIIPKEKIECKEKEISESKISMAPPDTGKREQEEFDSFTRSEELFTLNQIPVIEEADADVEMKRPFSEPLETEAKRQYIDQDVIHIEKIKAKSEKCQRMLSPHKINKSEELEACLGIKLMEFEIKKEDDECDGNENDTLILINPSKTFPGDAEIKPTVVDTSYNPEVNHSAIESGPDQSTSEIEIGNPVKSVEDVEEKIHHCKHCPYKAKRKHHLNEHMLLHKDISEVRSYQCVLCPYKTRRKHDLNKHVLIHKDPSETPTYDCDLCSYKAIRKSNLTGHMLVHKNASDVKTYIYRRKPSTHQCTQCPYKAKGKRELTKHMRTHVTNYCNFCSYKTKLKKRLTQHMMIHTCDFKNASEMETEDPNGLQVKSVGDSEEMFYHCKLCPYETKQKNSFHSHMLVHMDISEVTAYQCALCPYKSKWKGDLVKHMWTHECSSEVTTYDCSLCSFKAKQRGRLTAHMSIHEDSLKDASELETNLQVKSVEDVEETIYRCNLCTYETRLEKYLTQHLLSHKDYPEIASEIETNVHVKLVEEGEETIYRCKICPYKAKRKTTLNDHMLVHKDISEVTTYDCSVCSYRAKRKRDLTTHMLIHKDFSEVTTYSCNFCSYKTKRKRDLTSHMLIHQANSKVKSVEDVEEMVYRCKLCPYKAKFKQYLTRHMLVHKDISEVTRYQCLLCPHKTKRKHDLIIHVRRMHNGSSQNATEMETEDPNGRQVKSVGDSEEIVYSCKLCPYKSKLRRRWTIHMSIHKDISEDPSEIETENHKSSQVKSVDDVEETIYRCKICPYKSRLKNYLTKHMLVHKDISEVTPHQCKLCPYKTKRKCDLTQHMLIHKDLSEVTTYDCNFCSFKAKRKQGLIQHMPIHMDDPKDAQSAQTQQGSMSEYRELEGCSAIKSEELDIKDEGDEYDDASNKL